MGYEQFYIQFNFFRILYFTIPSKLNSIYSNVQYTGCNLIHFGWLVGHAIKYIHEIEIIKMLEIEVNRIEKMVFLH